MTTTVTTPDQLPALEQTCASCGGVGEVRAGERMETCSACGGDGTTATEFGKHVLDLVWKHFDGLTRSQPSR